MAKGWKLWEIPEIQIANGSKSPTVQPRILQVRFNFRYFSAKQCVDVGAKHSVVNSWIDPQYICRMLRPYNAVDCAPRISLGKEERLRFRCFPKPIDTGFELITESSDKDSFMGIRTFGNPASLEANFHKFLIYRRERNR
jgi:hypothetical protein